MSNVETPSKPDTSRGRARRATAAMGSTRYTTTGRRFRQYKEGREKRGNTVEMRCERFFANATAMAMTEDFGETCPCDARPGVEADAAPGCRFLSYDELPREDIKCSGMCQATDGIIALFVFFFFFAFVALVRRYRREEQAMRRELAYELQASFDRELARRRLEHSGKEFVAVRQPAGDLELAEVVVLEVEGEAVGQNDGEAGEDDVVNK